MNSFLDANVIMKKIEYEHLKEDLRKKCFEHIQSSKEKIFISFIVKEELNRIILKRKEIYENVIKKMKNESHQIDSSKSNFMKKEEENFAKELYLTSRGKDILILEKEFDSEIGFLNSSLLLFIKNKVNEIAINKEELDLRIVKITNDSINDFSDCRVLTSAIQMQQGKDQFLFVTCDKHFHPAGYRIIEGDSRLKEYTKPRLKNFLFDN